MYLSAIARTIRSRRFWIWQLGGIIIYAMPAAIRLATGSVYLPVLGLFEVPWIGHFIPGNLVEKILVNAFFPGAAGAIAGELTLLKYAWFQLLVEDRNIWLGLEAHCSGRLLGHFFSFGAICKT